MTKYSWVMFAIILLLLCAIGWQQRLLRDRDSQIDGLSQKIGQLQLDGGTVRSSTDVGTPADVERVAADAGVNVGAVRTDANAHGADIISTNVTNAQTGGSVQTGMPSTGQEPRPGTGERENDVRPQTCRPNAVDALGYTRQKQLLRLLEPVSGGVSVPWGEAGFSAWEADPWSLSTFPRTYTTATVIAEDDDGRQVAYNYMSVETGGKRYSIPITTSSLTTTPKPARFRWLPRLYLGVGTGVLQDHGIDFGAGAEVMFASYGAHRLMPDWTFLGAGVGYSSGRKFMELSIVPVTYRVGRHIPLIEDLYIGPVVTVGIDGAFGVLVGLRSGL